MANTGSTDKRPLSPHLQIYKPMLTMMMSVFHRGTGCALYAGMALLAWWLIAAAAGPEYFGFVNGLFGSWFGRIVLFGFTWSLMHHAAGGIRHLIWDTGRGFDLDTVERMARITPVASVVLTVAIWLIAYAAR